MVMECCMPTSPSIPRQWAVLSKGHLSSSYPDICRKGIQKTQFDICKAWPHSPMHAWECMYISVLCTCFSVALSKCCQKPHSQDNRIQLCLVIYFASLLGVRITVLESTFNDCRYILHPSQKKHVIDWEWWRTVCKPLVTMCDEDSF